jgi:DNA polymerase-3 subunit epsilon
MKLHLKRPLAFFDLETTGTNIGADRIVEISVIKLNPDGSEEVLTCVCILGSRSR